MLDAWTPAALHGHKRVTYVEDPPGESALAAARVFGEFADKMRGRAFTMVHRRPRTSSAARTVLEEYGSPAGLTVHPLDGPVLDALRDAHAMGAPIFAWFDGPTPTEVLSTVAAIKGAEILLGSAAATVEAVPTCGRPGCARPPGSTWSTSPAPPSRSSSPPPPTSRWRSSRTNSGRWTSTPVIRLRDPGDAEGTLLDIRVQPNLAPLRRALAARLAEDGPATLAELRVWTVHETIFRQADATRAVQAMVTAGGVARTPPGGRLSVDTVLALSDRSPPPDRRPGVRGRIDRRRLRRGAG